jgi:hypothetical protein
MFDGLAPPSGHHTDFSCTCVVTSKVCGVSLQFYALDIRLQTLSDAGVCSQGTLRITNIATGTYYEPIECHKKYFNHTFQKFLNISSSSAQIHLDNLVNQKENNPAFVWLAISCELLFI